MADGFFTTLPLSLIRALNTSNATAAAAMATKLYNITCLDNGQDYEWDSSSTDDDDGYNYIQVTGVTTGRFKRISINGTLVLSKFTGTFSEALTAAENQGLTIVVDTSVTLAADADVTVPLKFVGGTITLGEYDLVIEDSIVASPYEQIFVSESTGSVTITQSHVYWGWFGMYEAATDAIRTTYAQQAIDATQAGGTLHLTQHGPLYSATVGSIAWFSSQFWGFSGTLTISDKSMTLVSDDAPQFYDNSYWIGGGTILKQNDTASVLLEIENTGSSFMRVDFVGSPLLIGGRLDTFTGGTASTDTAQWGIYVNSGVTSNANVMVSGSFSCAGFGGYGYYSSGFTYGSVFGTVTCFNNGLSGFRAETSTNSNVEMNFDFLRCYKNGELGSTDADMCGVYLSGQFVNAKQIRMSENYGPAAVMTNSEVHSNAFGGESNYKGATTALGNYDVQVLTNSRLITESLDIEFPETTALRSLLYIASSGSVIAGMYKTGGDGTFSTTSDGSGWLYNEGYFKCGLLASDIAWKQYGDGQTLVRTTECGVYSGVSNFNLYTGTLSSEFGNSSWYTVIFEGERLLNGFTNSSGSITAETNVTGTMHFDVCITVTGLTSSFSNLAAQIVNETTAVAIPWYGAGYAAGNSDGYRTISFSGNMAVSEGNILKLQVYGDGGSDDLGIRAGSTFCGSFVSGSTS